VEDGQAIQEEDESQEQEDGEPPDISDINVVRQAPDASDIAIL